MNPIFKAMASGYGAQQILGFITKSFPSLSPKIQKAMLGGYSAQKILDFLSKNTSSVIIGYLTDLPSLPYIKELKSKTRDIQHMNLYMMENQ